MKIFKRLLLGFGAFLILVIVALLLIPRFFKDDIKVAIDKAIAENVNADVKFDVNNFDITLFRHFPRLTAEIKDLAVINKQPFEGNSLFQIDRFDVEINLYDLLFGDKIKVSGITMVRPQINVKVLEDGKASYDITFPSSDTTSSGESSKFSVGIDHLSIIDGFVNYDDKSMPYLLSIKGLNLNSSGDLTQDVVKFKIHSSVDSLSTSMGKTEFLSNKKLALDAILAISENYTKYAFMENSFKLNDFAMSFDGWLKMNPDNYDMDIKFNSPVNTFKSLLSLVPKMYSKSFDDIESDGQLSFLGFVKGIYSDKQMPNFQMALKVDNSFFKYPTLPTSVKNINLDLLVENTGGGIDNTIVNLKKFHADFGNNPIDGRLLINNLKDYRMNGKVKGSFNLEELNKMFPMDDLAMKGNFSIDALVDGVYDSLKKTIPTIDATMNLKDGYVKSAQLPMPLENLNMDVTAKNQSGKLAETVVAVNNFSMLLDGEKFNANMILQNLDDYTWDIKANGGVDLEKITKIFPIEGTKLVGKVIADIETKGKMSAVKAKKYDQLPTKGTISLSDFKYITKDLPEVSLSKADLSFDPKKVELKKLDGVIGKSDFKVDGSVYNLIGYVLNHENVTGSINLDSKQLDLNEFRSESTTATPTDTASLGVIPIPENIDFQLNSSVGLVKFMDYNLTQFTGKVLLKDAKAQLKDLKFNMLGGTFGIDGTYNTKDIKHPKYDLSLNVGKVDIQQVAASTSLVKTYAPIASLAQGNFSTNFSLYGELDKHMSPNLNTVNGAGLITIAEAKLADTKFVSSFMSLTNLNNSNNVSLKDVLMSASIADGRMSVKPFDVSIGNYSTTVSGSIGIDQSLDYNLKLLVPAGELGSQVQSFLNNYSSSTNPTDKVPINISIKGTFLKPIPKLLATEQKQQVKEAVTNLAKEKATEAIQKLSTGEEPAKILENILNVKKSDSPKTDTTKNTSEIEEATKNIGKEVNKLKGLFKKKDN